MDDSALIFWWNSSCISIELCKVDDLEEIGTMMRFLVTSHNTSNLRVQHVNVHVDHYGYCMTNIATAYVLVELILKLTFCFWRVLVQRTEVAYGGIDVRRTHVVVEEILNCFRLACNASLLEETIFSPALFWLLANHIRNGGSAAEPWASGISCTFASRTNRPKNSMTMMASSRGACDPASWGPSV